MSEIAKALLEFQKNPPAIHKNSTNPHFGNRFASLDTIVDAVRPRLNEVGLVLTQHPSTIDGKPALRTTLVHAETGDSISEKMLLAVTKEGPQEQGSALTYARRYAILSVLGLVADEDDDGNLSSGGNTASGTGEDVRKPSSPVHFVQEAQEAQANAKAARTPQDDGRPENIVITFGKKANGKTIGEAPRDYLEWMVSKFEPHTPEQRRIVAAAQLHLDAHPILTAPIPDDDVPF